MITRYLIAYDIVDPDRLRKVHAVVKSAAGRVQFSVYEALLTDTERVRLTGRLERVMNLKEDQVLFIDLGDAARTTVSEVTAVGLPMRLQTRGNIVF